MKAEPSNERALRVPDAQDGPAAPGVAVLQIPCVGLAWLLLTVKPNAGGIDPGICRSPVCAGNRAYAISCGKQAAILVRKFHLDVLRLHLVVRSDGSCFADS